MTVSRRDFLKGTLASMAVVAGADVLTPASAVAAQRGRRLVVIILRGAMDGLNVVVPHGDPAYYQLRPSIAIPRGEVLDLDGWFGFHPSLAPLEPLYRQGHLAAVHAAGSPDPTRSHFEAQEFMESGTPGVKSTADGWLNRCARRLGCDDDPLCAVAAGATVPRILKGPAKSFALAAGSGARRGDREELALRAMYEGAAYASLREDAREAALATGRLRRVGAPAGEHRERQGALAESLRRVALLMKSDANVRIAVAEAGGWDHHFDEGGVDGRLAARLRELATALAAFWIDLADVAGETVLVTLSEFGRTARENGTRGTDHGHGNVMLVLGSRVRGGAVYGRWPGLAPEQLHEGRDLAVTTDFRLVLAEVLERHLGCDRLDAVFPGLGATRLARLGLL